MFESLMTDRVSIRTSDGKMYTDVAASVQTGMIFTQRTDIPIRPGDQITRRTPAGIEEVFLVEDPGLHGAFHGMPAAYQMRVRRADALRPSRGSGAVIYNVTGANARFNINSVDSSTNVVNEAPAELFRALREAIQSNIQSQAERDELLAKAVDLEQETGKPGFSQRYAQFMALAAHHMEALGPFIPALTQLLTGWVKSNLTGS
jgi:hypothetical protein